MSSFLAQKAPIVFVPGLFGSMSERIIPGTGDWGFGFARTAYEPFIRLLGKMGYPLNEQLFVAFYDWRRQIDISAERFLLPVIERAKQTTGSPCVNLICHSMGGLVARAYVQSEFYQNDVDQLLIFATPNAGSPVAYSYWAGGKLPRSVSAKRNVVELYMNVYLAYMEQSIPFHRIQAIHRHFPSLLDLTPSAAYGDYLLEKNQGVEAFVPYGQMVVKNQYMDYLNATMGIIAARNIRVTLVAGIGHETIHYLRTVPSLSPDKWVDGRVVGSINSDAGDGNVMARSVFALEGERYYVEATHLEILYKSEPLLRQLLE
ncbi:MULTISPECIES: acetyltransferase [Brevibacillus]|uniref:lipase/acyltransferase domain-containing protein n=1 Tax=Brevibacillus TaxID=55080 RepID=UPI001C8DC4F5|nr:MULTISPECIES: acetyltransferase [Brevibacillus]MBY0087869.1 acetyltransferase [Brevibacillus brevis]MCE0450558.1 acetyltransferase [Brevibacillus sp. AF8]